MALGARDLSLLVLPTGWDAATLKKFDIENATDFTSVVGMLNSALAALNAELRADPLWSSLVSYTDQPDTEYRVGTSSDMVEFTEYGKADIGHGATEGHMLPIKSWTHRLGWTWSYLKRSRMSQLEADIADGLNAIRNRYRKLILTRLLQRGDDSGATKGLGSSGYSPGFATTAASTSVDFVPPSWGGVDFANTHEHYVGISGDAWTLAAFQDMKAELREHGHAASYEFITGGSDEAAIRALTQFTPVAESNVRLGATQDVATLSNVLNANGSYYIGTIEDIAVRIVPGMPQYYGFAWKTYGPNSQKNPLRVRLEKGFTSPTVIAMPDPNVSGNANFPVQSLMMYLEMGVGVGDRTNGTPRYNHNATWADGVAT